MKGSQMAIRRMVKYLKKKNGLTIQGVCGTNIVYLRVGHKCPEGPEGGGGTVASMEIVGNMIEIRKEKDGKPYRNFGITAMGAQGGGTGTIVQVDCDWVLFPISDCVSLSGVDVEVPDVNPLAKVEELLGKLGGNAQPAQGQQNQQRR